MTDKREVNEEMDRALEDLAVRAAQPLRAPVHPTEGFQSRTMAAARLEGSGRVAGVNRGAASPFGWLLTPKTIRLSPIAGLALAATLLIAVALGSAAVARNGAAGTDALDGRSVVTSQPVGAAPETVHVVRFQLAAPDAHNVALVGDFNDWSRDAIALQPADKPGVWTASVRLVPGRHEYAFIVDGERWVADPYAVTHLDEYDVESSVIRVGESGS